MSFSDFCESPSKAMASIAIVAILGLVSIGIISIFVPVKTAETLASVVKTLDGVLMIGLGAKAGLSIPNGNGNGNGNGTKTDVPKP